MIEALDWLQFLCIEILFWLPFGEYRCRGKNARGNNTCEYFDEHGNVIYSQVTIRWWCDMPQSDCQCPDGLDAHCLQLEVEMIKLLILIGENVN